MSFQSPQKLVVYLRVSTARQGAAGLGMDAQRAAVRAYAAAGGHAIVAEHVEVESGRKADRPQLAAALVACRLHRATLRIAKRRTVRSKLAELGISREIARKLMGHEEGAIDRTYLRYEFIKERRDALLRLEAGLLGLVG